MSRRLFDQFRNAIANQFASRRSRRRRDGGHRNLAFESLEPRALLSITTLQNFSVSENTGEKPQSKVWQYAGKSWCVMPESGGTWLWRLDGTQWSQQLEIAQDDNFHADVTVVDNLAHVLLYDGRNSQLASIEYDHGPDNRYEMWSLRPELVDITLSSGVETATLEVDTTGRMWIASDASSTVEVRYSDGLYTTWSAPLTVGTGISSDDISSIVAMPNGSIGVMWSNQSSDRFYFRTHVDGAAATQWSTTEVAASQSARSNMADDHINLAVASDGTLYAAVKTSLTGSNPLIVLLVRRPSGVWDSWYPVDSSGTRPIVVINEAARKLIVAYTQSDSGGDIRYKESSMDNISFGPRQTLIEGNVNNPSSVKDPFQNEVAIIASGGSTVKSVLFSFDTPVVNSPPNVNAGPDHAIQLPNGVFLNATVTDDGQPTPASLLTSWTIVSGPGSVSFGNAAAIDTTASFSTAGTYVLRLTASDGQLQASDTVTVVVQPAPSSQTNQPPFVDAGPNQSLLLGAAASLNGTISDDGLPASPGTVTTSWSKVSGPGNVTFANASAVDTTASFSAAGTYVLRLTASDGALSASDTATITIANSTAPVTIAFQDGLFPTLSYQGTRDTQLSGRSQNTNYGTNATLEMDGSPDIADLLYWELSAIPTGSVIESAVMELNFTTTSKHTYDMYVMERAWDELAATWNQASAGIPWATAGATGTADHGSTSVGQITPSSKGLQQVTLNQAGISVIQNWVNNAAANRGLIIQNYQNSDGADFATSETAVAAERPKLIVTYRAPGGSQNPPTPTNAAPVVNAGPNQTIQLPAGATLSGTVTDDGLPNPPATVTRLWTRVSGPGTVTFGNASAANTTAQFSAAGTYVLRLTANDGSLQTSDDVTVIVQPAAAVNQPPSVSAGPDQTIQLPMSASLNGTVTDDGLPNPPSAITRTWTKFSGPGTVTFGNASAEDTTASFSQAGTYVLRLSASDGSLQAADDVSIVVIPAMVPTNQPPTVNAGANLSIQLPNLANLSGTVSDDGLPSSPGGVSLLWTTVSGPGSVTYGNSTSANTTAQFSTAGTYVLRLTANDGQFQAFDELTVTVAAEPVQFEPPSRRKGR
jgi:hypothetical protein